MMKQVQMIPERKSRKDRALTFFLENFLTPHKILLIAAAVISLALYQFVPLVWALIPVYIHLILWLRSYFKHTVKRERQLHVWKKYVERYGDENGQIPRQTRIHHKRLIDKGEVNKIAL